MLKINIRDKIACPKHPRYNPAKTGSVGARAGCRVCLRLLRVRSLIAQLEATLLEAHIDADSLKDLLTEVAERRAHPKPKSVPTECSSCHGEHVIMTKPAGAGHSDDLAEYVPCPDCEGYWQGRSTGD